MFFASFFIFGVFIVYFFFLDARLGILVVCKYGIFYKFFRVVGVFSRNLKYFLLKFIFSLYKFLRKFYFVWNIVENFDF